MSELKDILKQVGIESIKDFAYINCKTRQAMYEALNTNPHRLNKYINTYIYFTASRNLKAAENKLSLCKRKFELVKKYKKDVEKC